MNVPNLLTLSRFALIPLYLVAFSHDRKLALAILLLAGATDILDGYIARSRGQVTQIGSMLDPLADKSMMITVMLSLLVTRLISWEAALAMLLRDAGMIAGSALSHFRGKLTVPANTFGKITTVLYYLAILLIIFEFPYASHVLWFVILFSFLTTLVYIFKFRTLNQKDQRTSSPS